MLFFSLVNVKDDTTTHVLLCDLDVVVVCLPAVHRDRVVLSPLVLLTVRIEEVSWGAIKNLSRRFHLI